MRHFNALSQVGLRLSGILLVVFFCTRLLSASGLSGTTYSSECHDYSVMIADDRYLWIGTSEDGLLRFEINDMTVNNEPVLYTVSNSGLANNRIQALAFDNTGAILIGMAQEGVARFDGTRWEVLSGSGGGVQGLAVDKSDGIWVKKQGGGVSRFDGLAWSNIMNNFTGYINAHPLSSSVWLYGRLRTGSDECSAGMLYEYVGGGLQSTISLESLCPETNYPTHFIADEKNCWIGNPDELMQIDRAGTIARFPIKTDTDRRKSLTAMTANANSIFLTALSNDYTNGEIYLYDPMTEPKEAVLDPTKAVILPDTYVKAACADYHGNFWLGASDGSITCITPQGTVTESSGTGSAALPGNSVNSLCIDSAGNLWAGISGNVILTDISRCIARFDGETWTLFPGSGDTLGGRDVSTIACDASGTVWAGLQQEPFMSSIQSGIAYFNGQNWRQFFQDHFSVKTIVFDNHGVMWYIADDGVYRYRDENRELLFERKGSSNRYIALGTDVSTIAFDNNNTPCIGTGLGIKKFINDRWIDDPILTPFFPASSRPDIPSEIGVNALLYDSNGTEWIGTAQGLVRCSNGECVRFDTANGLLPDQAVQCIISDNNGGAWIGTGRGLVHCNGTSSKLFTTGNSPLRDNDITALAMTDDGNVWVGTGAGGITLLLHPETELHYSQVGTADDFSRQDMISHDWIQQGGSLSFTASPGMPSTAVMYIISLDGKCIRRIQAESSTNISRFHWDKKDFGGKTVRNGLYLTLIKNKERILCCRRLTLMH